MINKSYYKSGNKCRVWFYLPEQGAAETVHLVGDFNDWDEDANPMKQKKDDTFYTAVTLESGKEYQFRYLLDEDRWENDWSADAYATNEMGTENSVVKV